MNQSGRGITQVPNDIAARIGGGIRPAEPFGMLPKILGVPLPWLERIPDSQDFNILGSKSTSAVEANISITNSALALGQGMVGVIRSFSVYVDDMVQSTNIVYTLKINGGPAPGFGNITIFPRAAASVANSFECVILLPPSATIEVFYSNVDGGTYLVGAAYSGWQYPEASALKWMATGPNGIR